MTGEYISKEAVLNVITQAEKDAPISYTHDEIVDLMIEYINKLPTEQLPKTGVWLMAEYSERCGDATCSVCGHFDWSDNKYCSECGARLRRTNL